MVSLLENSENKWEYFRGIRGKQQRSKDMTMTIYKNSTKKTKRYE